LRGQLQELGLIEKPSQATKALQEYDNALTRITSIYMNDLRTHPGLTGENFGVDFSAAVEQGLTDAFRAGLRENDVTELDEDMQAALDAVIAEERSHIPDLAYYLTQTAGMADTMGQAMNDARARLDMWINRYQDVYNQAVLMGADERTKLKWVLGATEEHCQSCSQLDGIVAYAREWDEAQIHPQGPPNAVLYCGGWKCDCSLIPTDERKTRGAVDILDRIRQEGITRG
jgi:hypothetical protein